MIGCGVPALLPLPAKNERQGEGVGSGVIIMSGGRKSLEIAQAAVVSKPSVYVETTIISYLTARPSRDLVLAAHQQITQEWWTNARPQVECFVSAFVIDEASRGDADYVQKRLEAIADFAVLEVNEEIAELAETYFDGLQIPEKAKIDAFHLALAVWHKMDYVLSWNCKHIASGRVQKRLQQMNERLKMHIPVVCTPEELMEV